MYIYKIESEHAAHQAHVLEENGGELPERPDYEYLVRGTRRQPANYTEHQEQEVPLGSAVALLQPEGELPLA